MLSSNRILWKEENLRELESALADRCDDDQLKQLQPALPRLAHLSDEKESLSDAQLRDKVRGAIRDTCPTVAAGDTPPERVNQFEAMVGITTDTIRRIREQEKGE